MGDPLGIKGQEPQIVSLDMIDVVDKEKDLPAYVFSKRFGNHLFSMRT
jgi:hypothetical protein